MPIGKITSNSLAADAVTTTKIAPGAVNGRMSQITANKLHTTLDLSTYYTHNALAIENGYKDDGEHLGLSAQEIQAIAPEIVTPAPFDVLADEHIEGKFTSKTGEDYLTVDYSKLVTLLIEAVKEQDGTINSLRNDVETLKDLVNKLIGPK
jgi:hypothetical protein